MPTRIRKTLPTFDWSKVPEIKDRASAKRALQQVVKHYGGWHWEDRPQDIIVCPKTDDCVRVFADSDVPRVNKLLQKAMPLLSHDDSDLYNIMTRPIAGGGRQIRSPRRLR